MKQRCLSFKIPLAFVLALLLIAPPLVHPTGAPGPARAWAAAEDATAAPVWQAQGNLEDAQFGYALDSAGDVNGDGFGDILIGAPAPFSSAEMRVFLYYGSNHGLSQDAGWSITGDNMASGALGASVAGLGDVNGDGFDDIAVGDPYYYGGLISQGAAFVYYGSASGPAAAPDWEVLGDQMEAQLGSQVAGAGDVNGDGFADLLISAPWRDEGQPDAGRVYLYLGSPAGLDSSPAWSAERGIKDGHMGLDLAGGGDVNGDGYDDALIHASFYTPGHNDLQGNLLFLGTPTGLEPEPAWHLELDWSNGVEMAGDVNGDGFDDLITGAPVTRGPAFLGRVSLYLGSAGGPGTAPDWEVYGTESLARFGGAVSTAGDFNLDGFDDLLVGACDKDGGGINEIDFGAAYLYFGSAEGPGTTADMSFPGTTGDYKLGCPLSEAGDINGDGAADILIGEPQVSFGQVREGRALVFGGPLGIQPLSDATISSSRSMALPGETLTYRLLVSNASPVGLPDVSIQNPLPGGLAFVEGSLTGTGGAARFQDGAVLWNGPLGPSEQAIIEYSVEVEPAIAWGTTIANSASFSANGRIERSTHFHVDGQMCDLRKRSAAPVLKPGPPGEWDSAAVWKPVVARTPDGYLMWYTGTDGVAAPSIGLATSPDGINWAKYAGNPVLEPRPSHEQDGVEASSVYVNDSGEYTLWYTAHSSWDVPYLAKASTPDGITWHSREVLTNLSAEAVWDDQGASEPVVLRVGNAFHLWYTGYDGVASRIVHMQSDDGEDWDRQNAQIALGLGAPGAWDWLNVYSPAAVNLGDRYQLLYSGETLPSAWQTGVAAGPAPAGLARQGLFVPLGGPASFDARGADRASLLVDDNRFKIWYSALGPQGQATIGFATAGACSQQAAIPQHPALFLPLVARPAACQGLLFQDDFGDPWSGWPTYEDGYSKLGYVNGEYSILLKRSYIGWFVSPGAKMRDFALELKARDANENYAYYGVVFGYHGLGPYYEIDLHKQEFSMWRVITDEGYPLVPPTKSDAIRLKDWNKLRVVRQGSNLALYINDQGVASLQDGAFTGLGYIGVVGYSPAQGAAEVRFDDFSLGLAGCPGGAAGLRILSGDPQAIPLARHPARDLRDDLPAPP